MHKVRAYINIPSNDENDKLAKDGFHQNHISLQELLEFTTLIHIGYIVRDGQEYTSIPRFYQVLPTNLQKTRIRKEPWNCQIIT